MQRGEPAKLHPLLIYCGNSGPGPLIKQEWINTITNLSKYFIITDISTTSWYAMRHVTLLFLGCGIINVLLKLVGISDLNNETSCRFYTIFKQWCCSFKCFSCHPCFHNLRNIWLIFSDSMVHKKEVL